MGYLSAPIAQQWKRDPDGICKGLVGERTVHAYTQDLGVGSFQLLQVLLEVLHLLGSTTGEGKNVESQDYVLLAFIVIERDILEIAAGKVLQFEIGGYIAHLQFGRRRSLFLCDCLAWQRQYRERCE